MNLTDTQSTALDFGEDSRNEHRLLDLPIDQVKPDADQPRRHFDPETLEDLAQSMAMIGQLQPIGVRREGPGWLIVYGERRWRAAGLLGWKTVQAREYKPYGPAKLVLQACENMHRDELTLDEYATTVLRLVEAGMPIEAVARALGRREAWAQSMLGIARDPVARALIDAGRLGSVDAWDQFMALRPLERKSLLDGGQAVTGPRCEREKERAERAAASRQVNLGLDLAKENGSKETPVKEHLDSAAAWLGQPDEATANIKSVPHPPDSVAHPPDGVAHPPDMTAKRGAPARVDESWQPSPDADDFPLRIPLSICLRLAPQASDLLSFYDQWDPEIRSTCVGSTEKFERLQAQLLAAIVALLDGQGKGTT